MCMLKFLFIGTCCTPLTTTNFDMKSLSKVNVNNQDVVYRVIVFSQPSCDNIDSRKRQVIEYFSSVLYSCGLKWTSFIFVVNVT